MIIGILFLLFNQIRTAKKILLPTGLIALIILAFPVGDLLIQPLEKRFATPNPMPAKIDGILVLGGGEDLKRSLSWQTPELGLGGDRYIAAKNSPPVTRRLPSSSPAAVARSNCKTNPKRRRPGPTITHGAGYCTESNHDRIRLAQHL